MNEEKHIRNYQVAVIAGSVLVILMLFIAWMISGPGQEWKTYQSDYQEIIESISDTVPELALVKEQKGILEYELTALGRTDRCITCHMGIENPYTAGSEQPFTSHPGNHLEHHPPEKYGCSICHGGQGQALNKEDAFGRDPQTHWDEPMLTSAFMQSSCGKCHLSIYSKESVLANTEVFQHGKEIFSREGCLGCHKARGIGGIVGPDLTEQGEKTRHDYNFQNISGEQTVSNWLKEHFKDPEMVSPGSQMLKIDLAETDLDALTTFVLGLAKPDISFEYFSIEALNEFKGLRHSLQGEDLFALSCSGCHGKTGSGKSYEDYETGVPAIMNPDFLRVASQDFIQFTLEKGRSKKMMASWMSDVSGLRDEELQGLAAFLKNGQDNAQRTYYPELYRKASISQGEMLFKDHCASCHGENGSGGLALSLNRKDLLAIASNDYLHKTIVKGRGNTAMPAWTMLTDQEIHAVIKLLRSWGSYAPIHGSISFSMADPVVGADRYHFLCSRCHGESGQGQTGPAIINRDFMDAVSDEFLYTTIASGREHSAMFGWSKDVYNDERLEQDDIGNIVAFLRAESLKTPDYIYVGSNPGDSETGKLLFTKNCVECHGEQGEGVKAPALNNQELLSGASNGFLLATMTIGREGTGMPSWGYEEEDHTALSGKERQDIVAFIRTWQRIEISNK